jgi:hypothetical protein
LYALCNAAVAIVIVCFIRFFPAELRFGVPAVKAGAFESAPVNSRFRTVMNTLVVLLLLSFVMCIVISVLGGLITVLIKTFSPLFQTPSPERLFKLALLRKNFPLAAIEILSRIPLNIIDRLLSVFGGYGIAVLLWRIPKFFKGEVE